MTVTEPEAGRLDRILAEQAAMPYEPDPHAWLLAPTAAEQATATAAENYRLRAMVAALESECAALADALGHPDVTHEYEPCCNGDGMLASGYSHGSHPSPFEAFCMAKDADGFQCLARYNAPVHRTPAMVRAELETKR